MIIIIIMIIYNIIIKIIITNKSLLSFLSFSSIFPLISPRKDLGIEWKMA